MKKSVFIFLSLLSISVFSWDGNESGKLGLIEMESGLPYSFRVRLENEPALCGNSNKWAYVRYDNPNYNAYVSALLAAKMSGKTVAIYANRSTQDYCEIGHLQFN